MIAERLANLASLATRGHVIGEDGDADILLGGLSTAAGERVSAATAQKVASVYACVTLISNGVRAMPLRVVRNQGDQVMVPFPQSRLWELLHDRPNPETHAGELWEWVTRALLLRGNAFCFMARDPMGRVDRLWPLKAGRVEVGRDRVTGDKVYAVSAPDDRERVQFVGSSKDILHFRGHGDDPLVGVSVIHWLRESIGRALSEDRRASTQVRNNGRPSGILKVKGTLDDPAAERLKARWNAAHGGRKSGGTAVLEGETDWSAVEMSSADMELVKQRAISREDIAIAFQVPGDMVLAGSQANLHYSSDASRDVRLVKHALMPWAKRIQDTLELTEQLPWGFTGPSAGRLLPRFNPAALLKADQKTRYEAHGIALDKGWMTPDEVRQIEDLEPLGLDKTRPLINQPGTERRNGHRTVDPETLEIA